MLFHLGEFGGYIWSFGFKKCYQALNVRLDSLILKRLQDMLKKGKMYFNRNEKRITTYFVLYLNNENNTVYKCDCTNKTEKNTIEKLVYKMQFRKVDVMEY